MSTTDDSYIAVKDKSSVKRSLKEKWWYVLDTYKIGIIPLPLFLLIGLLIALDCLDGKLPSDIVVMIGIALAAFDYVMDMQTERGDGTELFYARCAVLHAARAAGIDAFDVVYSNVNDEEGFLREVELIRKLGFNGKSLINPRQIELLHNAYAPTQDEVDYAQLVIKTAEEGERAGLGVISLNGKMIDAPIIDHARRVVERAQASGVRK